MTHDRVAMSSETEIAVEDPTAPAEDSPPVTSTRVVEIAVYIVLAALASLLAFDNWRTGMGWASDGPQAGYFPFYLSVILAGASLFGLSSTFLTPVGGLRPFFTRIQLRLVMLV